MKLILEPWPWYVAGPIIAFIMVYLIFFGKSFGMSSNFRTVCTLAGAGRYSKFFAFDWRSQKWNLLFVIGAILGGWLSSNYLSYSQVVDISPGTVDALQELGFAVPGDSYLPGEIFGLSALQSFKGIFLLVLGGFFVGFGARYAGGCTSGHAISGLSDLQLPSLLAVVGFFAGGLIMTYIFFPIIF